MSIINECYKDLNVKIIFSQFKLKHLLFISLHVRAVELVILVKPIGILTHVNEHLFRDTNSHIFKHLSASKDYRDKWDISCFKILDDSSTYSQLKIKESFHIEQLKPELNKHVEAC